jgi:hypothetical protein
LVKDARQNYRRQFLEMALRRRRPGSGSSRTQLLSRDWREPGVDLRSISTPYVIVGAVATSLYMPRRETQDLDILVRARDAKRLGAELLGAGFTLQGRLSVGGTSWRGPQGEALDVLELDDSWIEEALARPKRSPDGSPVIGLPYLVLLKLAASRAQDLADVQRMLGQADDDALGEVRRVVGLYRPEDAEDMESLIALGRLEFQ